MIFKSPYPDVEIPNVSLTEFVLSRTRQFGDKPALIDGPSGRTITYNQLAGAIRLVASSLAKRGFGKGDVFAIYSPNVPEYAVAFHAVSLLGGIVTTVNPLYTAEELARQLNDAGAKYLLTISLFLDNAQTAASQTNIEEIFTFDPVDGATPFAALLQSDGSLPEININPAEDLVVLPYSSGTTGYPKGVMLTHRNIVANIVQVEGVSGIELVTAEDTIMGILPFFHIYGMVVIMNMSLAKGATIVTMPRFDMVQFLELVQKHKITRVNLVPPILVGLAKHPIVDKYDTSSLVELFSGAAPLGQALADEVKARLNCRVVQGYGLTETSPVTHVYNLTMTETDKLSSIGPAIASTEVMVVDVVSSEPVGNNARGEIWIRGPQVMKGYLNNPDATAATIDEEGWLHTGDIGYVDDEGFFFIVDRLKELIKYKGFQVAPAELEALLLSHPAIADVAVIPSPDEEAGEVPKAFVVLKTEASAEEIMDWVAERVSPQKKVRRVEFVSEVPKSLSGKILRRVLVEQERAKLGN
ncbi:MAG: 4-coumarate--CoA ligase family protein [Ardenticatenaceae bacterium]|nr:4-coumarate--CoA ligase family protein [Anaerolineales bacterium]MCB8937448.1 4-coumarate--CoA ligase family protein [Ardenticatenaceae bacterium]MCB8975571.1 4-coumarate--CoA ligase family protein [Ardenticatenaceae bacterium]